MSIGDPMDFRGLHALTNTMGVRPPSDDIDEAPDIVEFGIAALDARVEEFGVEFPVGADHLAAEYGDLAIPVDAAGTEITLRDALEETPRQRFQNEQELLDALHPVFEKRRQNSTRGILAQLRALLPF